MSNYLTPQMLHPAAKTRRRNDRGGLFGQMFQAAVRVWKRHKMIAELDALDDAMLKDIGIYRGDIRRVVAGFSDRELGMVPLAPAQKSEAAIDRAYQAA